MKNITIETLQQDLATIANMFKKYIEVIYELQEGQPAHYDNQPKLIRLAIEDVRCGLSITKNALEMLNEVSDNLIED